MTTKAEIVSAVMSTFPTIRGVEVREAERFVVTIVVTVESLAMAEDYDLRMSILERLEPLRPAGLGFEVVIAEWQDRTVDQRAVAAAALAFSGSATWVESTLWDQAAEIYRGDKVVRTRFSAIAEELTAHISPAKKPPPPSVFEPKSTAVQIFEEVIEVKPGGTLTPCPKCKCLAFEPNSSNTRVICRGCPLPAPAYTLVNGGLPFDLRTYKCCSCGRDSRITMTMSEVNLYCGGCNLLRLHQAVEVRKEFTWLDIDMVRQEKKAESIATQRGWGEIPEAPRSDVADAIIYASSFQQNPEPRTVVVESPEQTLRNFARVPIDPKEKAVRELVELYRQKLRLRPFAEFQRERRTENERQLSGRDWNRQTGRTTRGLLYAIAEFVVSDLRLFALVAHTGMYARDLRNLALGMHMELGIARTLPCRPLSPADFDMSYDYTKSQSTYVYVDHTYRERDYP